MARHKKFRRIAVPNCRCWNGLTLRLTGKRDKVSHRAAEVVFRCPACERILARFYRDPVLERYPARAGSDWIGRVIRARRYVAWVGYARNPSTIVLDEDAVQERAARYLAEKLAKAAQVEREGGRVILPLPSEVSGNGTFETLAKNLLEVCGLISFAIEKSVKYDLWREVMYHSRLSLPTRGFWLKDCQVKGPVFELVRAQTGVWVSGYGSFGDWESPYLDRAVYHTLLVVADAEVGAILVHPSDAYFVGG